MLCKPFASNSPTHSFTPPVLTAPESHYRLIHYPHILWMCKDLNFFRTHWLQITGTYFPSVRLPTSSPPEPTQSSGTTLPSSDPDSGIDEGSLPSDPDSDSPPTLLFHPETPTQPIHLTPTANVLTRAQSKRSPVQTAPNSQATTPAEQPFPVSSRPTSNLLTPTTDTNLTSTSRGFKTPSSQSTQPPRSKSSPTDTDLSFIPPIPTFAEQVAIIKVVYLVY